MSLPNFNADNCNLWLQLQQNKFQLKTFAELALTENQDCKDGYLQAAVKLTYNLNLDAIRSGYYAKTNHGYHFDYFKNACLAEWLLAVGKTYFNGQFNFLGLSILKQLNIYREYQNTDCIKCLQPTALNQPNLINGGVLNDHLLAEQLTLLKGLLGVTEFSINHDYLISYRVSLNEAADNVAMHYKQAQIIESSLQQTLFTLTLADYEKFYHQLEVKNTANSSLSLCQGAIVNQVAAINYDDTLAVQTIKPIQQQLMIQLNQVYKVLKVEHQDDANAAKSDWFEWLLLGYALLITLQVKPQPEALDSLSEMFLINLMSSNHAVLTLESDSDKIMFEIIGRRCITILAQLKPRLLIDVEVEVKKLNLMLKSLKNTDTDTDTDTDTETEVGFDRLIESLSAINLHQVDIKRVSSTRQIQQLSASYDPALVIYS